MGGTHGFGFLSRRAGCGGFALKSLSLADILLRGLALGLKPGTQLTATLACALVAAATSVDISPDYYPGAGKYLLVNGVEVGLFAMLDVVAHHLLGFVVITARESHGYTP